MSELVSTKRADITVAVIPLATPCEGEGSSESPLASFSSDDALTHAGFSRFTVVILLISGLLWCVVTLNLYSPSILPELIKCPLHLTDTENTLLASVTYVGYLVGNLVWGTLSDRYGRKRCILVALSVSVGISIVFAFVNYYAVYVVCEILIGFFTAAIVLCDSLCLEFMPPKRRSLIILIAFAIPIGAGYYSLVGWRFLHVSASVRWTVLCVHALPCAVSIPLVFFFVPESPRFLLISGRSAQALQVFENIWATASVPPLHGNLESSGVTQSRGNLLRCFKRQYVVSTLLVAFLWLADGITYFGSMFLVAELEKTCTGSKTNESTTGCTGIDEADLLNLFVTTLGNVPAILFSLLVVDRLGRKKTLSLVYFLILVAYVPLFFCGIGDFFWLPLAVIRAGTESIDIVLELYAPELYPTYFRNSAISVVKLGQRIGMIASPYLVQPIVKYSVIAVLIIQMVLSLFGAIGAFVLPKETCDSSLDDSDLEDEKKANGPSDVNANVVENSHV